MADNKSRSLEEEVEKLLKERTRWRHFFQILRRKYIYIPGSIILIYSIDNPDINIIGYFLKFFKAIAGVG